MRKSLLLITAIISLGLLFLRGKPKVETPKGSLSDIGSVLSVVGGMARFLKMKAFAIECAKRQFGNRWEEVFITPSNFKEFWAALMIDRGFGDRY